MLTRSWWKLCVVLLAVGCEGMGEPEGGASPTPEAPSASVYYEDIAPIVAQQCASCHQPGAIAPFSLADYESLVASGPASKGAVSSRTMPPWQVGNGDCKSFNDARWLSDEEITLFTTWVDEGMHRRSADYAPPPPNAGASLPDSTLTLDPGVEYLPQGDVNHPNDDYRCFQVDPAYQSGAVHHGLSGVAHGAAGGSSCGDLHGRRR